MIVEHYELIRDGMPIKQGWRKWVADGGPADPRSTKGYMTYNAYRRMLSRIAYTVAGSLAASGMSFRPSGTTRGRLNNPTARWRVSSARSFASLMTSCSSPSSGDWPN